MFEQRDRPGQPEEAPISPDEELKHQTERDREELMRRHGVLIGQMNEELVLQAEERYQMQVDDDYHHHLQWDPRDAQVLMDRNQAPLVFNEGRLSVEWVCGTEKRNRIDYKILPRSPDDEKPAEVATKVIKYTDDVNMARYHRSMAFRQAVVSGLGWLEEGINIDPEQERIYAGSVDWRLVVRDSRSRDPDYNKDGRYLFRKRKLDLDYAIALMPECRELLLNSSADANVDQMEDRWYLGERLTSAHDQDFQSGLPSGMFGERGAFVGSTYSDAGRRSSVDIIECWYKVPENIKVFNRGRLDGVQVDPANEEHKQALAEDWPCYSTVKWRMRVMLATLSAPLWDGPSPFKHQKFDLIPMFGFRRGRDGQPYGLWRGMRDPQSDLNKRMSKALWAASSNRVIADKGAVDDVDEARAEFARPDAWIEKKPQSEIREVENQADISSSLTLADRDREHLRNASGVTNENLGRDTNATSGRAILAKQDQGSTTTAELFDSLRIATQLAGQIRLSNMQQFMTEHKIVRLVGENRPIEWLEINKPDPDTGEYLNDITAAQLDYIVDERDWNASLKQSALAEFVELIKIIAPTSPQAVVNLLDLLCDQFDIANKDEIVSRIRQFNGQRDPSRKPTPDEEAAMEKNQAKAELQDQIQMETMQAQLAKLQGEVEKIGAEKVLRMVEALYSSLQAGQIVAQVPGVAPVADQIAKGAGYQDQGGTDPQIPAAQPMAAPQVLPEQIQQAPELQQADGVMQGIETPAADGLRGM